MSTIKLPPLPEDDIEHDGYGKLYKYGHSDAQLRARDLEVARVVLEAAAKVLTEHQIPVGNSAAGEMACRWTYDALKECRDDIRNLEFKHHE